MIDLFGGDADVAGRIPSMMEAAGSMDVESEEVSRPEVPGSPLSSWIRQARTNHDNLVELGLLSADEPEKYRELMERYEPEGGVRFRAPTVRLTVGRKG